MTTVITYPQGNCLPHLGVRLAGFGATSAVLLVLLRAGTDPYLATTMVIMLVAAGIRLVRV